MRAPGAEAATAAPAAAAAAVSPPPRGLWKKAGTAFANRQLSKLIRVDVETDISN